MIAVTAKIKEAIPRLQIDTGCAVAVVDGTRLLGTLSKDDVLQRVTAAGRDPETTTVADVMTSPPIAVTADVDTARALRLMRLHHQCFLPIVDKAGQIEAWLVRCSLLEDKADTLSDEVGTLTAWIGADGPGG